MFIAVEGPDGAGKTSQVARLISHLGAELVPGCSSSPIGMLIRRGLSGLEPLNPLEMQAAYTADRLARDAELQEKLKQGKHLVSDRWTMSALMYGCLHLLKGPWAQVIRHQEWLEEINEPVIKPDLYIMLQVSAKTGAERIAKRKGLKEIYETDESLEGACRLYEDETRRRRFRASVIDAERSEVEVWQDVKRLVDGRISR